MFDGSFQKSNEAPASTSSSQRKKIQLCEFNEEIYDRIRGKTDRSRLVAFLNSTTGAKLTIKEGPSGARRTFIVSAPPRTKPEKVIRLKAFFKTVCDHAQKKGASLIHTEIRDEWRNSSNAVQHQIVLETTPPVRVAPSSASNSNRQETSWVYLTSPTISTNALQQLAHENSVLRQVVGDEFNGLKLSVSNGRICVDQGELDNLALRFPHIRDVLSLSFRALEEIASRSAINIDNVRQAFERAKAGTRSALSDIVEYTRTGKKVNISDINLPHLETSSVFHPCVKRRTCDEDPHYTPSETLVFLRNDFPHFVRGENNNLLKMIVGKVGNATPVQVNGPEFLIRGPLDKVGQIRDYIIKFGTLISEGKYKKPTDLEQALRHVLDDNGTEQLPSPRDNTHKRTKDGSAFNPALIPINELVPDSENQARYVELLEDDKYGAVMTHGPAGTGKTRLFLQTAMRKIRDYFSGVPGATYSRLIISIPLVNVGGKDLGAVPGDIAKKTQMWFETYYDHLERIFTPLDKTGKPDKIAGANILQTMIDLGIIEIAPLEFLRGKSFEGALVALDEAQNATAEQIRTFLTRAEFTSRLFVSGDLAQPDRRIPLLKEAFAVPSTVQINEHGNVSLELDQRKMMLGFHEDIGQFTMTTDGDALYSVAPYNGLAKAFILYGASPRIACTTLEKSDIRRSEFVFDILTLEDEFRITSHDTTHRPPAGTGEKNPHHALAHARREADEIKKRKITKPLSPGMN